MKDLYVSASFDAKSNEVILKVVNTAATARAVNVNLAGAAKVGAEARALTLASNDLAVENSLNEPTKLAPVEQRVKPAGGRLPYQFAAHSLTVLRVPCQ
jgi:alpha-N-arabinofuranosidase